MAHMMLAAAIVEMVLFVLAAWSVAYVLVFAVASHLPAHPLPIDAKARPRFLIIIPAYAEDEVVESTVRYATGQAYLDFDVCVVADAMQPATLERLAAMPITLLQANYTDSTKAKALQLAMAEAYVPGRHTHVLILDADNVIVPDMLLRIARHCTRDVKAIQLHRKAKNTDTDVAMLDAVSEEINNSIFRRGHNRLNMAAALIGSGMCLDAQWFAEAVKGLQSAGEDKEIERQLLLDGHTTIFADTLPVLDEKVTTHTSFGRQRRRWLAAQAWALAHMVRGLPQAFARRSPTRRLDYLDKMLQQTLVPRSLLMVLTAAMLLVTIVAAATGLAPWSMPLRWAVLDVCLDTAILLAIPRIMFGPRLAKAVAALPPMLWQMVAALFHMRGASHNFIHTSHGKP